jgi:hypothetical protein
MTREWQDRALQELFSVGERKQDLVERGKRWASDVTWKGQAQKFLELYCKPVNKFVHLDKYKGSGIKVLSVRSSPSELLQILTNATGSVIDCYDVNPEVFGRVTILKGNAVERLLDLVAEKTVFDILYGQWDVLTFTIGWRLLKIGGLMILEGDDTFLSKVEGTYRMLDKGYRVCLEKI